MASQWSAVGWQHLYMSIPPDWSIGAVNGDAASGYLRLDDAEMPRLEVRWEPAKGQEPIDKVVDRFLNTLVKKNRRKSPPIKVRRDLSLLKDENRTEERTVECFHWRTEGDEPVQAYGLLWRCQSCARVVFIQTLGRVGEQIQQIATRVLNSLTDHPEGDTAVWALYGMRFETPVLYTLKGYEFLTGRISLQFSGERTNLEIERLSLAEMHLQERSFADWFEEAGEGDVDRREVLAEGGWRHDVVMTSGSMLDPETANRRLAWLPWRRPGLRRFDRCGWHCTQGNKLFTLRQIGEETDRENILQIARSIVCH